MVCESVFLSICILSFSVSFTSGRWKASTQRRCFCCEETMNVDIWLNISLSNKNVSTTTDTRKTLSFHLQCLYSYIEGVKLYNSYKYNISPLLSSDGGLFLEQSLVRQKERERSMISRKLICLLMLGPGSPWVWFPWWGEWRGEGVLLYHLLTDRTHTHTHTHTHTCWFLWFTGTFHRRNGFYTVQAVCAIALHLPYT